MTEYTSPTSSPIGEPRLRGARPSNELHSLAALETSVDAIRFRFDNLDNDLAQERPAGAPRSMAEIIAQMRQREERFVQQLQAIVEQRPGRQVPARQQGAFELDTTFLFDLGHFLQLREEALAILRRLSHEQWGLALDSGEGRSTIRQLAQRLAEQEADDLNELAELRRRLKGDTIAGTSGVPPA